MRDEFPLAYHLTWGTYGTRLHGDPRGTVDREMNRFGDPIIDRDTEWESQETALLRFPRRILTIEQRVFIESQFEGICARGSWKPIGIAAATDHVHAILTASAEGKAIRKWLKRWISEAMNTKWSLQSEEVWWAECGSIKWIWTEDYLDRAVEYVTRQRATK
jgi:REP element-mobilizing transposase RayT